MLTKSSWLILLGLLPALFLVIRAGEWWRGGGCEMASPKRGEIAPEQPLASTFLSQLGMLAFALVLALFVVNLLYGFGGSLRRLDSYDFISKTLAGSEGWESHGFNGNRFRGTWLGAVPVPLPENLMIGVDLQKWDFDRERWSYFRGEWRNEGWWYYYLYGLATKLPLGFWVLFLIGTTGIVLRPSWRWPWQHELLLWTPMLLVIAGASLETGLNRHLRYVLPALPFAILLASRAFRVFQGPSRILRGAVVAATVWMITSSLWVYPHSLSYFNETVGGSMRADAHFNASNLDWGQDLPYLRRWQQSNPEKRPLRVENYLHITRPESVGIDSEGAVPAMSERGFHRYASEDSESEARFPPGWYAIDRETLLQRNGDYEYLRQFEPSGLAGYGFQIFEITPKRSAKLERQWHEMFEDGSE